MRGISRLREDFRAFRLLAPWSGSSSNVQDLFSLIPSAAQFPKSKATRGRVTQNSARLSRNGITLHSTLSPHRKDKQKKKRRDSTAALFTSFLFFLVFAHVRERMRKFLHLKFQPVLSLKRFFFGDFVSDSHKQISFLVKYIKLDLRTKKETTYKGQE